MDDLARAVVCFTTGAVSVGLGMLLAHHNPAGAAFLTVTSAVGAVAGWLAVADHYKLIRR